MVLGVILCSQHQVETITICQLVSQGLASTGYSSTTTGHSSTLKRASETSYQMMTLKTKMKGKQGLELGKEWERKATCSNSGVNVV